MIGGSAIELWLRSYDVITLLSCGHFFICLLLSVGFGV
jgi:hypothetical protein